MKGTGVQFPVEKLNFQATITIQSNFVSGIFLKFSQRRFRKAGRSDVSRFRCNVAVVSALILNDLIR